MEYEIVELEEMLIEGVGIRTTNQNGQAVKDIGTLWQKFFGQGIYTNIKNKKNDKTIGLYTDYEGDYTKPYQFITGTEVTSFSKEEPEDMVTKVIPKGIYAKFTITEEDKQQAIGRLWETIWQMNLPRSYICDFEEYATMDEQGNAKEINVYIGLRSIA
ncbi:MAG: GyrI-like domain-containing protein [Clostridia bacterium]